MAPSGNQSGPYRLLFEMALDPLCTVDGSLHFGEVNPAWENTLGWTPADLHGHPLLGLVHPDDRDATEAIFTRLLTGGSARADFTNRCRHRNGGWVPLSWVARSQDGVCHCSARVPADSRRQDDADKLKSEFVSTVSHELRTPLTAIRGALGLVAKGVTGPLPKQAQECVDIALANSERLVHLINDILDIEKIRSGGVALHLRPVELAGFIRNWVEENNAVTEPLDVTLSIVEELPGIGVLVDEERLEQVLANLISNAAKFSAPGQTVELSMVRLGEHIRVQVSDHGCGVSETFSAHIFEDFSQEDSSDTRRRGGTGLGLHISKALVEGMNGTIGFKSVPGEGTTFFFDLPIASAVETPSPARAPVPGIARRAEHIRVLYVEDDRDLQRVVRRLLPADWAITDATTVAAASAQLRAGRFDLVLLDLALPDGGGDSLLGQVGNAQVVIFSASEAEPGLAGRVTSSLVKSRTTEFQLRDHILALLTSHSEGAASG